MLQPSSLTAAGAVAVAAFLTYRFILNKKINAVGRELPGPPKKLVVGNLRDLPQPGQKEWMVYGDMSDMYGPIVGLNVLGRRIVVLDRAEDVKQLFWTRNSIYSNRLNVPMLHEIGCHDSTGVLPAPSEEFRARRKMFSKVLGAQNVKKCLPVQQEEIHALVRKLAAGADMHTSIKHMAGAIILRLAYGYTPKETGDYFVELSEECLIIFLAAHEPTQPVNVFPIVRYLPEWLPGGRWKRTARAWRKVVQAAGTAPVDYVMEQMRLGTAAMSFSHDFLTDTEEPVSKYRLVKAVGALYTGASHTTIAATGWILVALALHPEIKRRAQAEIDSVTHGERLPTCDDRERMPYLDAVVKEVYRWNPVGNLALPHVSSRDDEYKGYIIHKGSIMFANVWRILHDPVKYPEPFKFNPDRFLGGDDDMSRPMTPNLVNENPWHYIFGFGLRQCPGRLLADATAWLFAAVLLATVDVSEPVARDGSPITLESLDSEPGFVSGPAVHGCTVEFRSAAAQSLMENASIG